MIEHEEYSPEEVAYEKARACLEIVFEHIKQQASLDQREYLFRLYRAIDQNEAAYPLDESLAETFLMWCQSGQIPRTTLLQDLEPVFPDIYAILEQWFRRAIKIFAVQNHDGADTPFKRYRQYSQH